MKNNDSATAKIREAEAAPMSRTRPASLEIQAEAASDPSAREEAPAIGRARLCLNMIVKNEMANLERCLRSVADYIDCWVICDTGSTDGTQEFVRAFFAARNIPGELHSFPFHNFEQARNAALDRAHASPLVYDYLLLADADMELVVDDPAFRKKLNKPCYDLMQRSGVTYWNPRIVRRDASARYHGVTHEYLGLPDGVDKQQLRGVWYRDHASGSNRVDKFERDIRLLLDGLKQEPNSHRYRFYLAQSYKDAGRMAEAVEAYAKRASMGGWDEEAWYARLQKARCLLKLGDEGGFLRQALAAFNQRPQRAEPLYDLARFYREREMYEASVLFSEPFLAEQPPVQDVLFLEDYVYTAGLKEEYSIAANYSRDPLRKDRGFAACNWLALNRQVPPHTRDLARSNLKFYVQPASKVMPSFTTQAIGFAPPEGYRAMNPSVTRHRDEFVMVQRCANFIVTDGRYVSSDGGPIKTRNFLLRLDDELHMLSSKEILPPRDTPPTQSQRIQGFEDARLFSWRDALWFSACFRELNAEGRAEQALVRIDESDPGECRLTDLQMLRLPGPQQLQKNWMPQVVGDTLHFINFCDPTRIIDQSLQTVSQSVPVIAAEHFRGGSQAIAFDGGWLSLIHEMQIGDSRRHYHHRFVWFDQSNKLRRLSRPFFFEHRGIEYAAGLAWHPDGTRLVISYGVDDRESRIATVHAKDVQLILRDADALPSGAVEIDNRAATASTFVKIPERRAVADGQVTGTKEEQEWHTRLQKARRLRDANDEGGFIQNALAAFNARPHRAEPLYDLAKHYRERGINDASMLFCEPGLAISWPRQDVLDIDEYAYTAGLKEEFSIAANYARDPARKDRGFAVCNSLALNRHVPPRTRDLARSNLKFYAKPARAVMPSFASRQIAFTPPDEYRAMNPSIARHGDRLVLVQRCVNYTLSENHYLTPDGGPLKTRNFLLHLDDDLRTLSENEILPPRDMPVALSQRFQGFEDARPFSWRDALWFSACVRELNAQAWPEQAIARIDESAQGECRLADLRVLEPDGPRQAQKNWMPRVAGDTLQFIYLCDPTRITDEHGKTVQETAAPIAAEHFRGGSQAIPFDDGWLVLIHEVSANGQRRHYHHRFVWFDEASAMRGVSRPFYLERDGVEFAAGLTWHPDGKRLVITYSIEDSEAWIATVDTDDVRRVLEDTDRARPSGSIGGAEPNETRFSPAIAALVIPSQESASRTAPLVYIHSSWRTSSSWFFFKFRQFSETTCFNEPFNEDLVTLSRAKALSADPQSWDSHHPASDPYYLEYLPLISDAGGVQWFKPEMAFEWYIPQGGIRGELRPQETQYLRSLIRHAELGGKIPVLADTRTLGRSRAIKKALGGYHIFLHRNLWQQWLSYLYYRRRGVSFFYQTVARLTARRDDPYLAYLAAFYTKRVDKPPRPPSGENNKESCYSEAFHLLQSLPEHSVFAMFMALHVYLYLHAQLDADLTVDVTKMARDANYRSIIERELRRHTSLSISFSDVTNVHASSGVTANDKLINWEEIRDHVRVAIRMLSDLCDPGQSTATANEFVSAAHAEMWRKDDLRALSECKMNVWASNSKPKSPVAMSPELVISQGSEAVVWADARSVDETWHFDNTVASPDDAKSSQAADAETEAASGTLGPFDGESVSAKPLTVVAANPDPAVLQGSEMASSSPPPSRLFTVHGTVLYVEPTSGELRHGPPESSSANATLVQDGGFGEIVCKAAGSVQAIVCLADRSQTVESANRRGGPFTPTILEILPLGAGGVGLKGAGVFLCAEADGRVTLSRPACSEWEKFYVGRGPAERAGLEPSGVAAHAGNAKLPQSASAVEALAGAMSLIPTGPEAANSGAAISQPTGSTLSTPAPIHLFTVHGTVLYVDPASGELRHRTPASAAANAGLVVDGASGQIVCEDAGSVQPIVCLSDRCHILDNSLTGNGAATPTIFEIIALGSATVALKSAGLFLCAEADGRVTLSRPICSDWEEFRLGEGAERAGLKASAVVPKSGGERFRQLAPFLLAANSPQQRRLQSREFDARIVPFLDKNGAALPQIHCFYEARSDGDRQDSAIAATASMRTAGHPVRVWTYAPQKLDFLLPHGIEVRPADDVMPRGLFERIVAGSDIRYFSDVFRYAVLYEHGGLWMDTDVLLVRPFPFRGDYFFNLQWRSGSKNDHFICGNVMFAKPRSRHLRNLYEAAIERFSALGGKAFGDVGPKLLSEYFASNVGAELQDWLFSPVFFNAIDWTETDRFNQPLAQLAEYLNDERVFGVHLWNASNKAPADANGASLISLLSNPLGSLPSLTSLADKFDTDKNRRSGNSHCYARIYDQLLSPQRFSMRRMMEVGLCRGLAERNQTTTPSVALWQSYFPFCHIFGVDLTDFSALNNKRFTSFVCDQSKQDKLRAIAAKLEPGSLDVIIDDGSHASFDQQLTLFEFFPLLADGGWYFIEDLDWQPPGEDASNISLTKNLLREIQQYGETRSLDPLEVGKLSEQIDEILFFDSHYELQRANLLGGLVAIRKCGGSGFLQ